MSSPKIKWKGNKIALALTMEELVLLISGLYTLEKEGVDNELVHSDEVNPVLILKGQLQRVVNAKELVYSEEEIQEELKNIRGDVCLDCP